MNRSKFLAPRPANVLARERLISRLGAWDDKKLVIVHAQAGQGKSTLAAAYAASLPIPTVWYTMDAGDIDPSLFLACLGQALQSALPDQFPKVPLPPRGRYGAGGPEPSIARWVERMFGTLTRPCLIVFDDCHFTADSPAIRSILRNLFEGTPAAVRFMLLSRSRPELTIAKLRARRSVAELRGSDLKFSDQETQELFAGVFGMSLATAEAAAVNRTAEGWPAGLVLLHGFLMNVPGQDRLAALAGRRRMEFRTHIFDYLAQEVFSHLPQGVQDFLLRTAVADYLNGPLMSALTGLPENATDGRPSVTALVRELSARNLFVSAIDADGSLIRYHALFREFLLKTLRERHTRAVVKKLYATAAGHARSAGDAVRAINLWLESGETDRAVREIESCCPDLIGRGHTRTIIRWIDALPKTAADRPWFLFARAVACRYTDPRNSLMLSDRSLRGFRRDRSAPGQMLALSGIIESCFHVGGDFLRMGRSAAQANALLLQRRRGSTEERARLLLATGMAWFFTGRLQQSAEALRQSLVLFRKQGNHFYQVTCAIYLIPCALYQGDFRLARDTVRAGLEASDAIPEETGGRTALFLTRAMTALFEGNFAEAEQSIEQCRKLADDHAFESIGFLSLDIGGWLKIAQGDYAGAVLLLEECRRKGEEARHPFFSASASHLLAIAHLFQGRLGKATTESDRALALQKRTESPLFHGIYLIASGAILLKLDKIPQAERELTTALRLLGKCHAVQQEANAHLLLASIHLRRKQEPAARKHLAAGFSIGEERGFTYYALLRHDELVSLATAAVDRGIEPEYCKRLIAEQAAPQASPFIRIYCLGEFRVLRHGVPIRDGEWKSRLAKTFVKFLAARGDGKLSRDEAAETLWPDADPGQKPLLLNSLLHRTRKVLEADRHPVRGDSCILLEGNLLSLNPRKVWTDIAEFAALHAAARKKWISGERDPGKTLALYDQAFSLYQGDCLPGDLYHDWARSTHDHLKNLHIEMLKHAADLKDSPEDQDTASAYYEKMFALDQCDEKACRWLMARHIAAGQRSEAVRIYERCELALRKELDIEPDDQTRRLYRSIIGG